MIGEQRWIVEGKRGEEIEVLYFDCRGLAIYLNSHDAGGESDNIPYVLGALPIKYHLPIKSDGCPS
jgi:hypothetical protein